MPGLGPPAGRAPAGPRSAPPAPAPPSPKHFPRTIRPAGRRLRRRRGGLRPPPSPAFGRGARRAPSPHKPAPSLSPPHPRPAGGPLRGLRRAAPARRLRRRPCGAPHKTALCTFSAPCINPAPAAHTTAESFPEGVCTGRAVLTPGRDETPCAFSLPGPFLPKRACIFGRFVVSFCSRMMPCTGQGAIMEVKR